MTALPKPKRELDGKYLAWVKTKPCYWANKWEKDNYCNGPMDAHHVVPVGGGKVGSKTDDRRSIPACRAHHIYAETYPALFRTAHEPEGLIAALNAEYDATHKAAPKQARVFQPVVKTVLIRCDCGRTHRIGANKVAWFDGHGLNIELKYYCAHLGGGWKVATWG